MTRQDEIVKLLVERLGRHRPRWLDVRHTVAAIRRIIAHAGEGAGVCVVWMGNVTKGHYARLNLRLRGTHFSVYVHRLVDQLAHDPRDIPPWMEIDHEVCDTPPCFHPDHIVRKRRLANRRRSAENTNCKLRARREAEMREAA